MILVQLQTPCKESGTTLLMSSTAIADFVPRHGFWDRSFRVLASGSMHARAEGIRILLPQSRFRIPLDQQHGT